MKRIVFITLLIMLTLKVFSQYDTAVYYSKLYKIVKSSDTTANYYDKTTIIDNNNFKINGHYLNNGKWILMSNINVKKLNDTSYLFYNFYYNTREKDTVLRCIKLINNAYEIKDYKRNILVAKGYSNTVFPLQREGKWAYYSFESGIKNKESNYNKNQEISNRNWDDKGKEIKENIFTSVDVLPEYKDGLRGLQQFFKSTIIYPADAKEKGLYGNVIVTIVVLENGAIDNLRIFKGISPSLNEEALRVVKLTSFNWKPAYIDGKAVRYQYNIPVMFSLK
ncbi:MAG: energy transducer TonB [Bacteroidota bacterium]